MKSLYKVLFILVIVGLAGFTVVKNENSSRISSGLAEEFVPITVKENTVAASKVKYINLGQMKASWYGPKFHGRITANGEVYNQMAFTAAHKSLKFGTLLKITNSRNGKSVIVRINDRGPYIPGRQLDVSYAAALELGMIHSGMARVKVEEIVPGSKDIPAVVVM